MDKIKKTIEAALFMNPKPMNLESLSKTTDTKSFQRIEDALNELMEDYSVRDSAIEIVRNEEGYRMQVKPEFEPNVRHLGVGTTEMKKAITKTLAFIAYKQPVKQSMVVKYRSNKAYEEIKDLVEKGFVLKEKSGITYVLRTTKKFLDYFGKDAVVLKKNPKIEEEAKEA